MLGSFFFFVLFFVLRVYSVMEKLGFVSFAHLYVFLLFFLLFFFLFLGGACALMLIKGVYWSEYLGLGFFLN